MSEKKPTDSADFTQMSASKKKAETNGKSAIMKHVSANMKNLGYETITTSIRMNRKHHFSPFHTFISIINILFL